MQVGQMTLKNISDKADYLQFDICGLNKREALLKYENYNRDIPIILHGDWTKKGFSENNIAERKTEYVSIINELKKKTNVLGFTMHPPFRKKIPMNDFMHYCKEIEYLSNTNVFIENRSNKNIWLSNPDEIINFSKEYKMTIDIPQLYISCNYDEKTMYGVIECINLLNVKEIHLANIKRINRNTCVARKLTDGELDIKYIIHLLDSVHFITLEILGGSTIFDSEFTLLKNISN